VSQAEVDAQPTAHHVYRQQMIENNHDGVRWQHKPTDVQLLRLRKYYAANVTLIDEQIGHVMQALDKRGYLEDAIVIFTSDHGDCLGDHGHIQKWTMYDCVTRTPVIVHAPGRLPSNQSCNALLQQMDVVPMLFSLAGVPLPGGHSAIDALPVVSEDSPGREYVFAEHTADNVFTGASYMAMVRNEHWKLVQYQDSDQGELYDLTNDPGELVNVWLQPTFEAVKEHLISVLNAWYQHVSINH
jgi:arylsulfatase A-like enzyme